MKRIAFSCVCVLAWVAGLAAGEMALKGKVDKVTVYTSGTASVQRQGHVQLPAGRTVLKSGALPPKADASSIQVSVAPDIKVESVEIRRELVDEKTMEGQRAEHRKTLKAQEDKLFQIQQERKVIEDTIRSRTETMQFLERIRSKVTQPVGKEATEQPVDAERWAKTIDMLQKQADAARRDITDLEAKHRAIDEKTTVEHRKHQELMRKAPHEVYETCAYIVVSTAKAVAADAQLRYTVQGATWKPSYRADADIKNKTVALDIFGSVSQSSGEDWDDVQISLSTARPDIGTDVPVLRPWYLRTNYPPAIKKETESAGSRRPALQPTPTPELPAPPPPTQAVSGGVATVFTAESRARIPSDGQKHKIPVSTLHSEIDVEHVAIPKVLPHAFVRATTKNKAPFPLLPGVVDVMVQGDFVGRGMMPQTAAGEGIRLGLGVDEHIKIELRLLEDKVERKRRGDRVTTTHAFEIKATSFSTEEVSLKVIDQLPISQSPDVKVRYGTEARRALRGAQFPGQLQWALKLKAHETERIEFDFTVEYPEELRQALNQQGNRQVQAEFKRVRQKLLRNGKSADYEEEKDLVQFDNAWAF